MQFTCLSAFANDSMASESLPGVFAASILAAFAINISEQPKVNDKQL